MVNSTQSKVAAFFKDINALLAEHRAEIHVVMRDSIPSVMVYFLDDLDADPVEIVLSQTDPRPIVNSNLH